MKKVIIGNHAVAWGAQLARVEVVAAYPITPQTQIVEELSEMCADGRLAARYINVESEHSAMAACIGASGAGVRTFTATSAQGLALMHELLHWASLGRLPIVMADINRAMAPGWSIWTDQNDSLSQRDTGWIQLYCENNQEVLDTTIQSFKIAETVNLPVMLILDAFFLSHTSEPVDIPDAELVDGFLPRRETELRLNVDDPHSFGALTRPDVYTEIRRRQQDAMDEARQVVVDVGQEWGELTGRYLAPIECYKTEGAELLLVTSGTITSTSRYVVDELREAGQAVGLVKIRMFRPFPTDLLREVLGGVAKVAVLDRNISPGHGGIFAEEIRSALYDLPTEQRPTLFGYILGLGGRDVTPDVIHGIVKQTQNEDKPKSEDIWVGVKA